MQARPTWHHGQVMLVSRQKDGQRAVTRTHGDASCARDETLSRLERNTDELGESRDPASSIKVVCALRLLLMWMLQVVT